MIALDDYPENWKEIATRIKEKSGWKCERCGHPHEPEAGYCLTVHHLVPVKSLVEDWNLSALCQRCHLHIQAKVDMLQEYMFSHSEWFLPHLRGFIDWRKLEKLRGAMSRKEKG